MVMPLDIPYNTQEQTKDPKGYVNAKIEVILQKLELL
jgi:hypothetical protein